MIIRQITEITKNFLARYRIVPGLFELMKGTMEKYAK